MPEKQLDLSRKNAFFSDPFFNDLRAGMGGDLEKRLAEISARSMGLAGAGLAVQEDGRAVRRAAHGTTVASEETMSQASPSRARREERDKESRVVVVDGRRLR